MEFKGTKGPWKLANNDFGYYTSVRNMDDTRKICVSRVNNQEESNANMKLLSCTPEMLEMLQNARVVLSRMRRSMSAHPDCESGSEFDDITTESQVLEDEIEELIKKATS